MGESRACVTIYAMMFFVCLVFLLIGIIYPLELTHQLKKEFPFISSLGIGNYTEWENIPGTRGAALTHTFRIFKVTNPDDLIWGLQPAVKLTQNITYSIAKTVTGTPEVVYPYIPNPLNQLENQTAFQFTTDYKMNVTQGQDLMNTSVTTFNYDVFAQLAGDQDVTAWVAAGGVLADMYNYMWGNFQKSSIASAIDTTKLQTTLKALVTAKTISQTELNTLNANSVYGLSTASNLRMWNNACNGTNLDKQMLIYNMKLRSPKANAVIKAVCTDYWTPAHKAFNQAACKKDLCTAGEIYYSQFASGALSTMYFKSASITGISASTFLTPQWTATPEFPTYLAALLNTLPDAQKTQLSNINFANRATLSSLFTPSLTPDKSLFNATTINQLFTLGQNITIPPISKFVLTSLAPVTKYLGLSSDEETYAIFGYLTQLNKMARITKKGVAVSPSQYAFAKKGAPLFKTQVEGFFAFFSSRMIGAMGARITLLKGMDCKTWAGYLFSTFSKTKYESLCSSTQTNVSTIEGLTFMLRLAFQYKAADITKLEADTKIVWLTDMVPMLQKLESPFNLFIDSILNSLDFQKDPANDVDFFQYAFVQWSQGTTTQTVPTFLSLDTSYKSQKNSALFFNTSKTPTELSWYLTKMNQTATYTVNKNAFFQRLNYYSFYDQFNMQTIITNNVVDTTPYAGLTNTYFLGYYAFIYKMNGFPAMTQTLTVKQFIEGMDSTYLKLNRGNNFPSGGNPSLKINWNKIPGYGPTTWTLNSGHEHPSLVRSVVLVNSTLPYATTMKPIFKQNSNPLLTKTSQQMVNPWATQLYTSNGTDSFQFNPAVGKGSRPLFYSSYFSALIPLKYDHTNRPEKYGVQTWDFIIDGGLYETTSTWYPNYKYPGFFNATSVFQATVFVSPPYFSNYPKKVSKDQLAVIRESQAPGFDSEAQISEMNIERFSGLSVNLAESYQINFLFDSVSQTYLGINYFCPYYQYMTDYDFNRKNIPTLFENIEKKRKLRDNIYVSMFVMAGIFLIAGILTIILRIACCPPGESKGKDNSRNQPSISESDMEEETEDTGIN